MYKNKVFLGLVAALLLGFSAKAQEQTYDKVWTLEECLDFAMKNNLDVQRAEYEIQNNEVAVLQAKGQVLPTLSVNSSYGFRFGRSINPITNLFEENRIGNFNLSGNSNVTLFAGRRIVNNIKQNQTTLEASIYNLEATENNVMLSVVRAFLDVILAEEQLKIAKKQLETTSEQLVRTKYLVEAGSLPMSELFDLQSQLATNEVDVINAENAFGLNKLALMQTMQMPADQSFELYIPELEIEEFALPENSVRAVYNVANETLPQIKNADLSIVSSELALKSARGGYSPTLGFGASMFTNYADRALANFEEQLRNNQSTALNMQLSIPIFNGLQTRGNVQRAKVNVEVAKLNAQDTRNVLRQEIETVFGNALAAAQTYQASLKRVASTEESFRMAKERYDIGDINFVDYQVAQNNLFNAQVELSRSKYQYIFRVKILDFYLGNPITL